MDAFGNMLAAVTSLAVVLERLVEYLVKPPLPEKYYPFIPYLAAFAGLGIAFGFSLDLITPLLAQFEVVPAVDQMGEVVTGLLIGGGSNLLHDLWPQS